MTRLAVLRHEEGVRVDAEQLVRIYAGRTRRDAEEVLQSGLEDIARRVDEIRRHHAAGNGVALIRSAGLALRIAGPLGMASFVAVARDLIVATRAADHPAEAATLARLVRVTDRSLSAICDLRDMTV